MEWGLLKGNDLQLNSHKIIKYLDIGCCPQRSVLFILIGHGAMED
ncbi:MAG: hypothetical protein ACLR1V_07450 [Coprococcus sp.]